MNLSPRALRILAIGLVVLVATIAAAAFVHARRDSAENAATGDTLAIALDPSSPALRSDVAIPVEGAEVVQDTLVISVTASGQAGARRQTTLLAQVAGLVRSVSHREGTRVALGRTLVAIDPAEYQLAVEQARARVAAAQAQYREMTLFDDRIGDESTRAERRQAARAKSGLESAEVDLRKAQMELQRTSVTAPFGGRIASVRVVPGQHVRAGDELLTIVDSDVILVEVQVLESEVGHLLPGRHATVIFAAFPGERFTGRIETINPLVDRDSRTAKVIVSVPNPAGRILPGMYARVSLEARRFPDRVLVPRSAILERDRRPMLFVYEPGGDDGLAKWRYVTPGLANDSLVEIVPNTDTEMVRAGETVLTRGHYTLVHDARVRLVQSTREAGGRPE